MRFRKLVILNAQTSLALIALICSSVASGCSSRAVPGSYEVIPDQTSSTPLATKATNPKPVIAKTYIPKLSKSGASNIQETVVISSIVLGSKQDSNLNGEFKLSEEGLVRLPYQVQVSTLNKTQAQLRAAVVDGYRPFFRDTPDIIVVIKEHKQFVKGKTK